MKDNSQEHTNSLTEEVKRIISESRNKIESFQWFSEQDKYLIKSLAARIAYQVEATTIEHCMKISNKECK